LLVDFFLLLRLLFTKASIICASAADQVIDAKIKANCNNRRNIFLVTSYSVLHQLYYVFAVLMYETSFLYIQKKMFSEIIAARENSRKLV